MFDKILNRYSTLSISILSILFINFCLKNFLENNGLIYFISIILLIGLSSIPLVLYIIELFYSGFRIPYRIASSLVYKVFIIIGLLCTLCNILAVLCSLVKVLMI